MTELLAYLDAFMYGIAVLIAMIGWGAMFGRLVFPGRPNDWGLKAGWGLALTIIFGGVLEAAHWISRTTISIFLAGGLVLFLLTTWNSIVTHWRKVRPWVYIREHRRAVAISVFLALLLLAQYGSWVFNAAFFQYDDYQAYLVFPQKMVQTGCQGADPFNMRRITTGLGGQSFLHAIALNHLKEKYLHLIDPGLGILILAALVIGGCRQTGFSLLTCNVCLAFLVFADPPNINITMLIIGAGLFLAIFRTMSWIETFNAGPIRSALVVSFLVSAVVAGKSTLIPTCVVCIASSYLVRIIKGPTRGRWLWEAGLTAGLTFVMLLPWMVSMYQSCGTLFFPFLGKGFARFHNELYEAVWTGLTNPHILGRCIFDLVGEDEARIPVLGLLTAAAWIAGRLTTQGRASLLSIVIGAWIGIAVTFIAPGGLAGGRYAYPFVLAAILALLIELLGAEQNVRPGFYASGIRVFILICLAAGFWIGEGYRNTIETHKNIVLRRGNDYGLKAPEQAIRYAAMQNCVSPGQVILARLERPYLLDFQRNQIFVMDFPNAQSLPPGMPFFQGSEILAEYLSTQSIRYVVYSCIDQASFRKSSENVKPAPKHPYYLYYARSLFDFQDNLEELRKSRKLLYDDGDIYLIDLLARK